jgi:hypothetical protein
VIPHCRLAGRTAIVIAIAAFVLWPAPSTIAQDARGLPWWTALPDPTPQAKATLLQNVQRMPVSSFDPKLPPISLDAWLFLELAPRVEILRSSFVEWHVEWCGGYAAGANPSVVTATGPELCAKGTVQVSAERNVQIVILVADAVRGALEWRPTPPSLREVYIERVKERFKLLDSLDVPQLSGLTDLLQTPFEQWPKVDFETQITWDPPMPLPGDTVRVSISVRNTGQRSANRAWVNILIAPCCDHHLEVRRDWFPYLAAGQSARAEVEVVLPDGRAQALVSVKIGPSAKRVLEARPDTEKHPTQSVIGDPPRLMRTAIRFECRLAEAHATAGLRTARVAGSEQLVYLHQDIIVSNGDISRTRVVLGNGPSLFNVAVEFSPAGAEKMRQATASHPGNLLAILVNGNVVAAPILTEPISTSVVISGNYPRAEAERLTNGLSIR